MKKYINFAIAYAVAAMAGGVFYREFTKWNAFAGATALGKVHGHLFMLGMVVFLFIALFSEHRNLSEHKTFRVFMWIYNIGLQLTAVMFIVRGIPQVLCITLSTGANAAISGIAGIGHIMVGVGLILLLVSFKKAEKN